MSECIAVYPGTFDPVTLGHLDLIRRASQLYDRLIVAVAAASEKPGALFPVAERIEMLRADVASESLSNVSVEPLDTLLVDFCRLRNVRVVVRGVRVYSDFEYEFQMALTNRKLSPGIETLFMMPNEQLAYVSSSTVREIARYGGDLAGFVTPAVAKRLKSAVSV